MFITLKKKVEDLTVKEFFNLQKEQCKFVVVSSQLTLKKMQAWTLSLLLFYNSISVCLFVFLTISRNSYMILVAVFVRSSDHDPDFNAFQSQTKSCNEAVTKFEEAAKLRKAAIIRTAMGEEWRRESWRMFLSDAFLHLFCSAFVCLFSCCLFLFIKPVFIIIAFLISVLFSDFNIVIHLHTKIISNRWMYFINPNQGTKYVGVESWQPPS